MKLPWLIWAWVPFVLPIGGSSDVLALAQPMPGLPLCNWPAPQNLIQVL